MFLRAILVAVLCTALSNIAVSEIVTVKYRGPVPFDTFPCTTIDRSSFIHRICYDSAQQYMVILINQSTVAELLDANLMGKYFIANIKGSGSDGPFDCRTHRVPGY